MALNVLTKALEPRVAMRLTDDEIRHFRNVLWGVRFWRWFRWVLLAVLA